MNIVNTDQVIPKIKPEHVEAFKEIFEQSLNKFMDSFMGVDLGFNILLFESNFCEHYSEESVRDQITRSHGIEAAQLIEDIMEYNKWYGEVRPDNSHLKDKTEGTFFIIENYRSGDYRSNWSGECKRFVEKKGEIIWPFAFTKEDKTQYHITHLPTGTFVYDGVSVEMARKRCRQFAEIAPDNEVTQEQYDAIQKVLTIGLG